MQKEKKFLLGSLIGLFTFPFIFIIICGLLCIKIPTLYPYIDIMLILFVAFVVFFVGSSYYFYKKLDYPYLFDEVAEVEEEEIDEDLTVTNIIGYGSVFVGDIQADDDVLVEGTLKGNITTKGNVFVGGILEGNASCNNLVMHAGTILGSVDCIDQAIVDDGSCVKGDVSGYEVNVSGKVEGSVVAQGQIELTSTGYIGKDAISAHIEKSSGAIIKGQMKKAK